MAGLVENGIAASGWDPYRAPDNPIASADIINLGFVVNVIEDLDELLNALARALFSGRAAPGSVCHARQPVRRAGTAFLRRCADQAPTGVEEIDRSRRARIVDLEVYFALRQFERSRQYKYLERSLQRDIREICGGYRAVRSEGCTFGAIGTELKVP